MQETSVASLFDARIGANKIVVKFKNGYYSFRNWSLLLVISSIEVDFCRLPFQSLLPAFFCVCTLPAILLLLLFLLTSHNSYGTH